LVIGWIIALLGGIAGLFWSFYYDLPSGAAMVCAFGVLLLVAAVGASVARGGK
jgi:zinc/manganese transport system permease protein